MAGPVQQKTGSAISGSTLVITLTSTPTVGNILICCSAYNSASVTITGISQTGVTWAAVTGARSHTTAHDATIWVGTVGASPGLAITITYGGTSNRAANVSEWGSPYTATLTGTPALNTATSTNPTTGTTTPAVAVSLVIAMVASNAASTVPTNGFTALTSETTRTDAKIAASYLERTSAAASSTGWTAGSSAWDSVIAAFAGSAAGRSPRNPTVNFQNPGWMMKALRPSWRPRRSGLLVPAFE